MDQVDISDVMGKSLPKIMFDNRPGSYKTVCLDLVDTIITRYEIEDVKEIDQLD